MFGAWRVLTRGAGGGGGSDLEKAQRLLGSGNVLFLAMVVVIHMRLPKL